MLDCLRESTLREYFIQIKPPYNRCLVMVFWWLRFLQGLPRRKASFKDCDNQQALKIVLPKTVF